MSEPWKTDRLGKYCYIKARIGWRGLSSSEYTESGPYLIAGKHIENGIIDWDACDHISEYRYRESWEIALAEGDVIITKDGTIGRVARVDSLPGKATINGTMMLVRPEREIDYRFLYHILNGYEFKKLIEDKVSGSSIPHIFQRDMVTLPISFPQMPDQGKLADVLDTLDTAIHETEAIIAKLKAVKQGLLHDLLTRGIDANGELRPSQTEAQHLYKESPLGWIPMEWTTSGLANVAPKDRSVIRTGPFGSSLKGEHWRESGRPVVTIGSLGEGTFIASELLFVDERTANSLADFELVAGDIAFSRVADVGRAVVISENESGWIMSSNFMRISVNENKVRPRFLQMLLSSSLLVRKQIRATVNSAGRDVANSAVLLSLQFPWPAPEEQDRIINRVKSVDERITAEEAELVKQRTIKLGLMNDLLTGRVRVTPLLEASPSFAQRPAAQIAQEPAEQTGG